MFVDNKLFILLKELISDLHDVGRSSAKCTTLARTVVAITGAADGIGFAIAEVCLQKGAKTIIILDISVNGVSSANTLNSKFGDNKAVFIKCDVTKDLDEVFNIIVEKYKYVDILVNCAGICDEFNPQKCFDINVVALINWNYKFEEHMRKDKGGNGGTIINIASGLGLRVTPFMSVYSASKFAVVGFSKSLGHIDNYKRTGVRIFAMCPGRTNTTFYVRMLNRDQSVTKDWDEIHETVIPNQEPGDVARATAEVFETAESGTAWLIDGAKPVVKS